MRSPHVVQHGTYNEYNNFGCRCDACRAAASEYQRHKNSRPCERCGVKTWTGICVRCSHADRATTVREDTLRCCECGEWKQDDAFPRQSRKIMRRGRHSVCRGCAAAVRQRARRARTIPCIGCGQPRLHPHDAGRGQKSTGLCRSCFTSRRVAAA